MRSRPARYKVLIVDDAPAVREARGWALLETNDLAVVGEAGNGADALTLAASLMPDVVIVDIEMPGIDGFAVARSLKRAKSAPVVVFLTVHDDADSRKRACEAGGDGFVEKGIGWPEFIAQVRRCLKNAI